MFTSSHLTRSDDGRHCLLARCFLDICAILLYSCDCISYSINSDFKRFYTIQRFSAYIYLYGSFGCPVEVILRLFLLLLQGCTPECGYNRGNPQSSPDLPLIRGSWPYGKCTSCPYVLSLYGEGNLMCFTCDLR